MEWTEEISGILLKTSNTDFGAVVQLLHHL